MNIILRAAGPRFLSPLIAATGLAILALYFHFMSHHKLMTLMTAGLAILSAIAFVFLKQMVPVLVIDEGGIFDARLGVGRITWDEITQVSVEATYGNRFLCLSVREPKEYLSQLYGERQERMELSHALGFQKLNVDVGDLNINLLDLKNAVDSRIPRARGDSHFRV